MPLMKYESNRDKDQTLSIEEYLDKIRPYLINMINDLKTQREWKIQLTIVINFFSSKDSDEAHTMHFKSDNMKIVKGNETNEIIEELFDSLLQKYKKGLEESMKSSEFVFDSVDLFYYEWHEISLNRGGSYVDYPKWLKNKAAINLKNSEDKCFQYAVTITLNHKYIVKDPQRISKINPFIDQCNWKEIDFPSHKKNWKKFETNNQTIALNNLYLPYSSQEIRCIHIKT